MATPCRPPWRLFGRHLLPLALATLFGALLGSALFGLFVGTALTLAWHLTHLYQLERWLHRPGTTRPPNVIDPTWAAIYQRFQTLDRRSRKRKRKLNRILRRFNAGVSALPAAVVVLGKDAQVEWSNRSAQTLLGLRPVDAGTPIIALVRSPAFIAYLAAPDPDGVVISAPHDADVKLRVRVVRFAKKQRLLLATDVSEAQRTERMRRDFVANASHELRTPLTVIVGYIEALLDGDAAAENPRWRPPLTHMQGQAARMQRIIEDLLMLADLESGGAPAADAAVAVPRMLYALVDDARSLSGDAGHRFSVDVDDALLLLGNERELYSAFSNLIFNAVKHTPPGTAIDVEWTLDDGAPLFSVADGGGGIAPQHLDRLSERFYRVDRSRQRSADDPQRGTGLGLAIVKHVLQRHDGRLSISSAVGIGSRFSCRFDARRAVPPPRRLGDAAPAGSAPAESTAE